MSDIQMVQKGGKRMLLELPPLEVPLGAAEFSPASVTGEEEVEEWPCGPVGTRYEFTDDTGGGSRQDTSDPTPPGPPTQSTKESKPSVEESAKRNECSPLSRPLGVRGGGELPVPEPNELKKDDMVVGVITLEEARLEDIDWGTCEWLGVLLTASRPPFC